VTFVLFVEDGFSMTASQKGIWLALFAAFCWAFNGVFARLAANVTAFGVVLGREVIGLFCFALLVFLRGRQGELRASFKNWKWLLLLGIFFSINGMFSFLSYKRTYIAATSALSFTFPVMVALATPIVLKEKVSRRESIGIFIAVIGIIGVFLAKGGLATELEGNLFALCGAVAYAAYSLIIRKVTPRPPFEVIMTWIFGVSLVNLTLIALIFKPTIVVDPTMTDLVHMILLGIFAGAVGHTYYNVSIKYVLPHKAGVVTLTSPLFTAIAGLIFLRELPPALAIGGIVVSLAGIYLTIAKGDSGIGRRVS
jgi:drug/metabolite transporter (DMT)-like permease